MSKYNCVFIVGHPGAGKGFLAKTLADKLQWTFINADLGLESTFGRSLIDILGHQGKESFDKCQEAALKYQLTQQKIVVATDGSIVCSEKNRQLLSSAFVVFLKTSTAVQIERSIRNQAPLLPINSFASLLDQLHSERDDWYEQVSHLIIDGDSIALNEHIASIIDVVSNKEESTSSKIPLEKSDLTQFHKTRHTPVQLTQQQATCLKLVAEGQPSKEIARLMNISFRTVEGYIADLMEKLGCTSSKDLIALYHKKP